MNRTRHVLAALTTATLLALAPAAPTAVGGQDSPTRLEYRFRIVASGLANPSPVAVHDGVLFLGVETGDESNPGALARIELSSGALTLMGNAPTTPGSFAVDRDGRAYLARTDEGDLVALAGPGGVPEPVLTGLRRPGAVASNAHGDVCFVEDLASTEAGPASGIVTLDEGVSRVLLTSGKRPTALAVDSQGLVYWTSASEGQVLRLRADGRSEVLLRGLNRPTGIAVDPAGRTLYFSELPTPGVGSEEGGRNTVNALDLSDLSHTVIQSGEPDPVSLAAGDRGTVYWASAKRGVVIEAVSSSSEELEDEEDEKFRASLTGAAETPAVSTRATGSSEVELDGATGPRARARVKLKARGLIGFTAAHIHLGAPGQAGPIVAPLYPVSDIHSSVGRSEIELEGRIEPSDLVGPLAGNWNGFVAALRSGGLYVNVHTRAHPAGEIRGQLLGRGTTGNQPPNGTITSPAGNLTITAGQSVSFAGTATDPNGDSISVFWSFGDGGTSTALTPPSHVYAAPGVYDVVFTATDSTGLVDPTPATRQITVNPVAANQPPNGTITAPAGNVTITAGGSVSFAGTATDPDGNMVTVLWSFGDGSTSTSLTPGAHVYATAGSYAVTFTATDSLGLADPTPATRTITVQPPAANQAPNGTITSPAGNVTIVAGQSVTFAGTATDPDGNPVTVLWSFGDGTTSTSLTPGAHVYSAAGTFAVTFTATDSLGLADPTPATRTITVQPVPVNQPPNGTITSPAGNVTITAGQSVTFAGTASDPDGNPVTVLWSFGDGGSSTALSPGAHVYATAGTFNVTFTATDSLGLADPTPATRTITVNPVPANQPPNGTITLPAANVTITAGQSVSFAGTASDPDGNNPVTVLWSFGDGGTSTTLTPGAHIYATAGTFAVTFTATDSLGLSDPTPATRTITVSPAVPTATLSMVQTQVFTPKCTNCHGGSSPEAGMNLQAGLAYANLVNVSADTQPGFRVVPGQPLDSVLYNFLVSGHRSSSVTAADRQLIFDWITAGAQNN